MTNPAPFGYVRILTAPHKGRRLPIHGLRYYPFADRMVVQVNIPTRYDSCIRERSPGDVLALDPTAEAALARLTNTRQDFHTSPPSETPNRIIIQPEKATS